mmetsp:Transcript_42265/g.128221  ORF Transcript_42265/g.128221 Transcript_42265/m.128221 type:complete len:143 (-) Transcript_42265:53-481(-)
MCPPLPLNSDGTLNASAASYVTNKPQASCQTLRLPIVDQPPSHGILATSSDDSDSSPTEGMLSLSPRGINKKKSRHVRLSHEYVAASLPKVAVASTTSARHNRCHSNISELYRKCRHHEVTAGGVSCRNVVMEYLQCTAGDR